MSERFSKNCELLSVNSAEQLSKIISVDQGASSVTSVSFPHGSRQGFADIVEFKHLYVLYGLGDCEFALRVLEHEAVHELLIFEPSVPHVNALMHTEPMTRLLSDARVGLIVGQENQTHIAEVENYFSKKAARYYYSGYFGNLVTPGTPPLPGYQDAFVQFAEAFRLAINNYTVRIKSMSTEDCLWGLMNSIRNIDEFVHTPPLTSCQGLFAGKPGIVVGSGPSLKHSLPYLKKVADRAVLVCCDSTLKMLLAAGIEPHLVCCLERQGVNAEYFKDLPEGLKSFLVTPLVCNPQVIACFPGKKFSIQRGVGFESWLLPPDQRFFLGSFVSHLAMVSLAILGCREMYLVGMDGAYAPGEGNTYSDTASDMLKVVGQGVREDLTHCEFEVTGHDGLPKKTQRYWFEAAQYFGEIIRTHKLKVHNVMPLDHGIPIPETDRLDPEQLEKLSRQVASPWSQQLSNAHAVFRLQGHNLNDEIKKGLEVLHRLVKNCQDAVLDLSLFFMDHDPVYAAHRPAFYEKFRAVEKQRLEIMLQDGDYFQKIMVPIILNEHALIEYELRHIMTAEKQESHQLRQKTGAYLKWFNVITLWGERAIHCVERLRGVKSQCDRTS